MRGAKLFLMEAVPPRSGACRSGGERGACATGPQLRCLDGHRRAALWGLREKSAAYAGTADYSSFLSPIDCSEPPQSRSAASAAAVKLYTTIYGTLARLRSACDPTAGRGADDFSKQNLDIKVAATAASHTRGGIHG